MTLLFSATPFLISEIGVRFGVSAGLAGAISVGQVGGFAATTLLLPRFMAPTPRVFRIAIAAALLANLASALAVPFWFLVGWRFVSGVGAGAITWVAWSEAMRVPRAMSSIAATGPVTALIGYPLLSVATLWGDRFVFGALAVSLLPALLLHPPEGVVRPRPGARSRSRSNRVLLGALMLLTFAGSSLFVYAAVAARDVLGMSNVAASFGFSLNAGAGLIGARLSSRHRRPGIWLATAGPAVALMILGGVSVFFYIGMAWWGFSFWMGVPGVLQMLSARSLVPEERAGDAQGLMALGRTIGPLAGGAFTDAGALVALSVVSGLGMTLAGVAVVGVQEGRDRLPPTDPRTVIP